MRQTISLLFTIMLVGLVSLNANETTNSTTAKLPSFEFTTVAGKNIKVSSLKDGFDFSTLENKNVITLFYIYSGQPCRNELKVFSKIKKRYTDLEFVTFELKGLAPEKFEAFEKELDIEGLHMINSKQAMPFASYITNLIKWKGAVPLLIITNKKGTVKHMQLGAMSEKEIEDMIKTL